MRPLVFVCFRCQLPGRERNYERERGFRLPEEIEASEQFTRRGEELQAHLGRCVLPSK